ncbi:MAG: response regulator [Rhizobiales bacterium]|nr:response regulator [Hyphomicrobiales bacterium]
MLLEGRSIALIEDDPIMGESLWQALRLEGARVKWWRDGSEARRGLAANCPDIVICDIRLPDGSGADLYCEISSRQAVPPFLFMTAYGTIDEAVGLLRAGASDYITKPFDMENLLDRVNALAPACAATPGAGTMGASPAMRQVEALLLRVADLPSAVLLCGPTGSGKEVAAAFLHSASVRADQPFVAVNCAALPADLMESEIFGHERGAFTGAHASHKGYAERAGSGILFLDEIGEMPLALQAKLLRLVEVRSFTRVGGERPLRFDARLVCASNSDLAEAVVTGAFRPDLYHRINTIEVRIPPLAERREDIEGLLRHFFEAFNEHYQSRLRGFTSTALEMAHEHDWPGNVRELRNRVERAVALAAGEWIMPADLFPDGSANAQGASGEQFLTLAEVRARAERRQIERALAATAGNATDAAELLGVSRTTLWEKMKRLAISSSD